MDSAINAIGEKDLIDIYGPELTKSLDIQISLINMTNNSEPAMVKVFEQFCDDIPIESMLNRSDEDGKEKPLVEIVQRLKTVETEKLNASADSLEKELKTLREKQAKLKQQISIEMESLREECNKLSAAASVMDQS